MQPVIRHSFVSFPRNAKPKGNCLCLRYGCIAGKICLIVCMDAFRCKVM